MIIVENMCYGIVAFLQLLVKFRKTINITIVFALGYIDGYIQKGGSTQPYDCVLP